MSLMNDLEQYVSMQQANSAQENQGFSQLGQAFGQAMKEKDDEKRRQENVKKQMSQAQQWMQAMSQMKDNSAAGKALGTIDDDAQKRRKGVISVADYTSSVEQGIGEDGMPYFKASIKSATPQEQKAQFEVRKAQIDMEKAQAKADLLDSYIEGQVQEGAILGEMATLGITADEFDIATQARQRLKPMSQSVPQGFEATGMTRDKMGNLMPSDIKKIQIPTEADNVGLQLVKARLAKELAPPTETVQDKLAGANLEKAQMDIAQDRAAQQEAAQQKAMPVDNTTPEGYRPVYEKDKFGNTKIKGYEVIPATEIKAKQEMADSSKAGTEKIERAKANASNALGAINEIRKSIGYFGRVDAYLPATAGTEKVAWTKNIDRVKAMLTLENLLELKNASKNGASGLGALSDGERAMLENAATALDKGLPKEKAEQYLNEIEKTLTKVMGGQQKIGRFLVEAQ